MYLCQDRLSCTNLINPEFSNYDIVNCSSDFLPRVMISCLGELEMRCAMWNDLKILATEFAGKSEFLPEDPVLMLSMKG